MENETNITSLITFVGMFTKWLNDNNHLLKTLSGPECLLAIEKEWSTLPWAYLNRLLTKPEILNSKEQSFSYPESEE